MLTIENLDVAKELTRKEQAAVRGGNLIALEIPYPFGMTPPDGFPRYIELPPPIYYSPEHGLISPQ